MSSEQFLATAAASTELLILGAEHLGGVGLRMTVTTLSRARRSAGARLIAVWWLPETERDKPEVAPAWCSLKETSRGDGNGLAVLTPVLLDRF